MFRYEVHSHTAEMGGCGKIPAAETVRRYKNEAGYDGIVITDHYQQYFFEEHAALSFRNQIDRYLMGYRAALRAATKESAKIGFTVMLGAEIRFNENANDYLVYGFDEDFLYTHENLCAMTIKEFRNLADENGLLIYQAHPFRSGMIPMPEYVHGIEVFNGNARHDSQNDKALQWAQEYGLKQISGSDYHETEDFARGGIILNEKVNDVKELVQVLKTQEIGLITP